MRDPVAFVVGAFYKAGCRDAASGPIWARYLLKLREVLPGVSEARAAALLDAARKGVLAAALIAVQGCAFAPMYIVYADSCEKSSQCCGSVIDPGKPPRSP